MPNSITESAPDGLTHSGRDFVERGYWGPLILAALALIWFYVFEMRYGVNRHQSALGWLWSAWNPENDFEHGPMFPLVIIGMIVYRFKSMKATVTPGSLWGLAAVLIGALFYAAAYRTLQPRVAMGALPFLLWGSALYLWGWGVARLLLFPLFFTWLAIPLPSFQQATVRLQIIAAKGAHFSAELCGVNTMLDGTRIMAADRSWGPLEIAEGCSGIRSLWALMMISGAWAYVADMSLWKRALLFASAVPLAIIGNVLRVTSICVIAKHGDAEWAANTWHDWSGLLLFYPFSLMLLLCLHSLLEGGLPWRKNRRIVSRQVLAEKPDTTAQES
jgi:exosortase